MEKMLWAEIDLNALCHNLKLVRKAVRSPCKIEILCVVKADAYGHGMQKVAQTLLKAGVGLFGVSTIEEAVHLRVVCPKSKILVLGGFHKNQIPLFFRHRIRPTLSSLEDLKYFLSFSKKSKPFPVHVKIDTGMGRFGVWHEEAIDFFKSIKEQPAILVEGIYTHFASADHADKSFTHHQLKVFNQTLDKIKKLGFKPLYTHAANSMGLARFKEAHFNLVRPGIVLYGIDPSPKRDFMRGLKAVLSLKARVCALKRVGKGRTFSYGSTYTTHKNTTIAVLPVGYSHGFKVGFSNKASVLINQKLYPVVGRVTMDQILVDVGPNTEVRRWDVATLIGTDGPHTISANQLARHIDTIPYEILCSISPRVPRVYLEA